MNTEAKPFLRWAGSKRQILPTLAEYWNPSFTRYVEPFMGSACLFFKLNPKTALLGDLNADLVQTYNTIRDKPQELATVLHNMPKGKTAYYKIRSEDPAKLSAIGLSARFIYLNKFCFNGLFRTNLAGKFNVPYGSLKVGDLPTLEELETASRVLKRTSIKSGDFENLLKKVEQNDFVYLDPPFAVSNRRVFKQYGPQTFGTEDLIRLADWLGKMDKKGTAFVVSYAYCREALEIFKRWPKRKVLVQRNIAGFAHCRRRAAELLISNISPS